MTLHVYAGPSLSGMHGWDSPEVCAHPPIAHGDLYRLRLTPGDAILIVDGVYQHSAPVRHKEILSLCADAYQVYGAASIGALRAAELYEHGMTGLGTVFGWYLDGRLESDADVALMHGEADIAFRPFSHALVSVIGAVDSLVATGRLDRATGESVVEVARSVHFSVRSDAAVRAAAREAGLVAEMDAVLRAIAAPLGDIKQADAVTAVRELAARHGSGAGAPVDAPSIPDTSYGREWQLLHTPAHEGPGSPTRRQVLAYAQLFLPDFPQRHTRYVIRRLGRPSPWLDGLAAPELAARGLLSPAEVHALDPAARATRVLVRSFRLRPGRLVFDDLPPELGAGLPELIAQCARMLRLSDRVAETNPMFHPADIPPDVVDATFQALWRVDDLAVHVLDRGFRDVEEFRLHARPFFVAARAAVAMHDGAGASGGVHAEATATGRKETIHA